MASDVLVSDTAGAGANNEFEIMTSNNGDQVQDPVVVDLMASPNNNGAVSSDGDEKPSSTEPETEPEQAQSQDEEINPSKLLKMAMAENGGANGGEEKPQETNGHCNGDHNGNHNGEHNGVNGNAASPVPAENGDGVVHHETAVVNSEETTSPEGEVVTTTTTTVVKVDETMEGDTQVVTTSVKTTTVSYQTSELVVEVGQNDAPPVEAHELAAIVESGEPPADGEQKPEEDEKPAEESPTKLAEEAGATAASVPAKEAKQSTARRLFNFVRSPTKQKSIDDPTMAAKEAEVKEGKEVKEAESKAKSPPHQRRLFGWRKTWTPEKGEKPKSPEPSEKPEGEKSPEDGAEEKPERPSRGKKAKTSEEGNAEATAEQPAAQPPKQKKAKKSKQKSVEESPAPVGEASGEAAPAAVEEKVVSPKKKLRLGLMKKSKSTTASPAKPEKSAAEKWQAEKCAEGGEQPTEHATPVAALDSKPVTEEKSQEEQAAPAEAPVTPLKEEEIKVAEAPAEIAAAPEGEKKADEEKKAEEPPPKKEKKEKKPTVRKSWTFRMNRSHTESEKMANKSATMGKEAPAALSTETQSKQPFSPGKPFFAGFLHRKKKSQEPEKVAPAAAATTEQVEEVKPQEPAAEAPVTASEPEVIPDKVATSMSMPQLTPEKHAESQTAAEKWAAEGCPGEVGTQDVVVSLDQPASTSTAVKKDQEASPMRRSASLRMPSSLSRFFRFLGPRHRTTTVAGALGEEPTPQQAVTPPPSASQQNAPHTTSLTTPVSPRTKDEQAVPATDSKTGVTTTPGRHSGGFRFWSTWRSSGGPSSFGKFRRKDKNATAENASHDDSSLIVNTSLGGPAKSATLHDMPRGQLAGDAPSVDLGAILARLPPHSPKDHSPSYIGISRVLNGYAEYNSPTRRSGASSQASHKSPGGTFTAPLDDTNLQPGVECSGSLLQPASAVCQTGEVGRDANTCLATADSEQARLEGRCATVRSYLDAPELTAEARGQIEATLGKTNLLLTKKFKQFRDLCQESLKPAVEGNPPPPNTTDLAGFWDLVLIQVHDLDSGFDAIEQMKLNGWVQQAATNGTSQPPAETTDTKKQKKKKQEKKSKTKTETEGNGEAEAKAKSRFAEFKQRMFKGKEKPASASAEAAPAVGVTNGVEASVTNGVNGEASASVTVAVEEAKS